MQNKSHHGFCCCRPFASDYHSHSCEIPYLIDAGDLHLTVWDNSERLLHNLNETYVYNSQDFFKKEASFTSNCSTGKSSYLLPFYMCFTEFSRHLTASFAIFQGSNLKQDTCQFIIYVYI